MQERKVVDDDNELRNKIAYGSVKQVEKNLTKHQAIDLLVKARIVPNQNTLTEDDISINNYS